MDGILKKLIRIPVSDKDHAWKSELPVSLTEKNNILIRVQKILNPSLVQINSWLHNWDFFLSKVPLSIIKTTFLNSNYPIKALNFTAKISWPLYEHFVIWMYCKRRLLKSHAIGIAMFMFKSLGWSNNDYSINTFVLNF